MSIAEDVRFESTQKHQRAVTSARGPSAGTKIRLFGAPLRKLAEYVPLSKEELKLQRHHFDRSYYEQMVRKEFDARLRKDYFQWQSKIDCMMRLTLLTWMHELCTDMRFQRTTLHMALAYVDKFLEQVPKVYGPEDLQLIGLTAVYLAAKVEEIYVPTVRIFSKSTNYSCSVRAICRMERTMMQAIGFRLHPVTLVTWADWFTREWDVYAEGFNMHAFTQVQDASFRSFTQHSYNRIRTLLTYLDAIAIDYRAHEHSPRQLIAALIYLIMGSEHSMAVFMNQQHLINFANEALLSP